MNIVGTWQLASYIVRRGEKETYPLGEKPVGLVVFTQDGRFTVQIMRPDRPRFASNNLATGTDDEVKAAFAGYVAYFGTYTVDAEAGMVRLEPVGSLYPNWLGETQNRIASVSGNTLTLTTPPTETPRGTVTAQLCWERVA